MHSYHDRTKHASGRYAAGPAFLDWDCQPNPFREFEGARRLLLPLGLDRPTPAFSQLDSVAPSPLNAATLGLFLELALGLSAWKEIPGARWALRNNPSSGNLHPTEGWVILPPLDGIGEAPALYHYVPLFNGLEERCRMERLPADLPPGSFLLALSSIAWREAWKYGERAFRYCQHDVGHALAAASYAGACLGWRVRALTVPGDETLGRLLGLDRPGAFHRHEGEHPDLIALVSPDPVGEVALAAVAGEWFGEANRLSEDHEPWPVIDEAFAASLRPDSPAVMPWSARFPRLPGSAEAAGTLIRRRRSAQRMDRAVGIGRDAFMRCLARTLPDSATAPWWAFPWSPRLALSLFVHRVEGLASGLYMLVRDADSLERLRAACDADFAWAAVEDCPLPLYLLQTGDLRWAASHLSCQQAIAGHGAFSLGMIADFGRTLDEDGAWAYRRLFWEAGMIGQVLYLEATAAGVSGTGIGCYHDDEMHDLLGLRGDVAWQSLYHFTVGGAIDDTRIATQPAYGHLSGG
ncbi:nitroreductase [Paramagnetospirillum kuznetsovii]|uniref:Nitroreductase n=1 Tax=Paramagnetospirillum kuznetsovii TaxID=2053833 RepID=A0A364P2D5_9PROT|nr:SagB/ThcOx family dehydrogenase [Paramagnetospirillum kuznetsovii]RAU23494.1 nitroreductase [Paramagnetospirillum kuznetsovii]